MQNLLSKAVQELTDQELQDLCVYLNDQYRQGTPRVSDDSFDFVYLQELAHRFPNHELINKVQPEQVVAAKGRIPHPAPMLSTEKAYEVEEIEAYVRRCESAASGLGIDPVSLVYRITAKLDGIAGRLVANPKQLITRGDGQFGNDISHLLTAGLVIKGNGNADGVGEVVMPSEYFDANLAEHFAHPRNLISGMASSDNLNEHAQQAMKDGAVHLVLYRDMPAIEVDAKTLIADLDKLVADTKASSPYPLDGTIIELVDERVKSAMGKTSHHHNWQIAKKEAGETAEAKVKGLRWQVGRTGRITPVIEIEPTQLSGAVISNVTGHHAQNIINHGIGEGAVISIIRSGEVIPKHLSTTTPVAATVPEHCPCCSHDLEWEGDFLVCNGAACSAQAETSIIHHFKTIQADHFGPKTVAKLVEAEYTCIEQIYMMNEAAFQAIGLGAGQSKNLVAEVQRVIREPLRDNLLLASLGISNLGRGASEKLLAVHRIESLEGIKPEQIQTIEGFGDITSQSISQALRERADTLKFLLNRGFNLTHTQDLLKPVEGGSLHGINIVFTGSMTGSRDEMKADAKAKGANVQSSVNGKTNILVCGARVGQKKMDAAAENGAEIITEAEYWERYAA